MILNMGPQHPATHGVLRVELRTDGEIVKAARPHIGYLHRCFEKHCENVDYPGVMPYADRLDYCAAMGNTLGFALAVEKLCGIEVSPYVNTLRVVMAELQRIASHTIAVGTYTMDIGAFTPFLHLIRDREKILDLFEWTCGARLLYNYNWVGGVSHDIPDGLRQGHPRPAARVRRRHLPRAPRPHHPQPHLREAALPRGRVLPGARDLLRPHRAEPPRQRRHARPAQGRPLLRLRDLRLRRLRGDGPVRAGGLLLRPELGARRRDAGELEDPPPGPRPAREDGEDGRPREGAEAGQAPEGRGLLPLRGAPRPARLLRRLRREREPLPGQGARAPASPP